MDEGGPRRELFCLIDRMVSTGLMTGADGRKTFAHNLIALHNKDCYYYGQFVALALQQGSSGPKCFLPSVTDYILYSELANIKPHVDEIPDLVVHSTLVELLKIAEFDKFSEEASFNFPSRFEAGNCKPIVTKMMRRNCLGA